MPRREIEGNIDTGLLKMIAIVCMIIDHMGARIFRDVIELRIVGRIAFPLYLWCMVVGAVYTRDPLKYAGRLLLAGVISQPFYMLGLNHGWNQLNVMFTLLLGYMAIAGMRINRYGSRYWAPLLALFATNWVQVDYGMNGVLLAILLYLARERRGGVAAVMVAFCVYWGTTSTSITSLFGYYWAREEGLVASLLTSATVKKFLKLQTMAILALPLMLWRKETRTPLSKWAAYAAYPGHLFVLWIVQLLMGITTLQAAKALIIPWM